MQIDIKVTEKNIEDGVSMAHRCPIALALRDAGAGTVNVHRNRIIVSFAGVRYVAWPTMKTISFITNFDIYKNVKPDVFRLQFRKATS